MRYGIIFFIFISIFFITFYTLLSIKPTQKFKQCSNQATKNLKELSTDTKGSYKYCKEGVKVINNLKRCYEKVERESIVPTKYIELIANKVGFKFQTKEEIINNFKYHCPSYK